VAPSARRQRHCEQRAEVGRGAGATQQRHLQQPGWTLDPNPNPNPNPNPSGTYNNQVGLWILVSTTAVLDIAL